MPATLLLIWDYDSALGQINSTMPYNFRFDPIHEEIENVEYILSVAGNTDLKMTFACLGFAAEESVYPFSNPLQIRKIFEAGHEIASHSWRHEWFPLLTEKQIFRSLERSKSALEKCIGKGNIVVGFVPPHSRPMSWYKKFSISLGDRAIYPFHKGGDLGYIIKQLSILNYKWCRVLSTYKPIWEKVLENSGSENCMFNKWEIHNDIICVPQHYTGFDEPALKYLEKAIEKSEALVIVGHPAALSRYKEESRKHFDKFIEEVIKYRSEGKLEMMTVTNHIQRKFSTGANSN
ncbi:MAG: polysaccharide deacetylase family protein [Ignavibacteria bacterium]